MIAPHRRNGLNGESPAGLHEDREQFQHAVRELVLAHGRNSTAWQILNPGIRYWFSETRDAVVGYVRYGRFVVVAGGPVASDSRFAEVFREFEADARAEGCRICWFAAESFVDRCIDGSLSHSRICLGAQPVWDPAAWDAGVAAHPSLRAQLRRARNKGVAVAERDVTSAHARDGLGRCLEEWLQTRRAPTMHFLVEPQTLDALTGRRLFVAQRAGEVVGFLVASPVPRRGGWLVEQIIRGGGAVNGTSELLVDAAMRALAASGSSFVTLGLAPLSHRAGDYAAPVWLRALLAWLRAHGRRFYNFEGLETFKAKMRPQAWEPVFAVTDRRRFSPEVLLAIGGAFTGGRPVAMTARALAWAVAEEARTLAAATRSSPSRIEKIPGG